MRRIPFYPLLVGVILVLGLYSRNRLQLTGLGSTIVPILGVIDLGLILLVVGRLLLRSWSRSALVVTPLLLLLLVLGSITKDLLVGLVLVYFGLVAVGGFAVVVKRLKSNNLGSITLVGNILLTCIVAVVLTYALVPGLSSSTKQPLVEVESASTGTELRDVYYIVMDTYGNNTVLWEYFNYDNSEMTDWLSDKGFTYYPEFLPNYVQTAVSIPSILSMEYLNEEEINRNSGDYLYSLLDNNLVKEEFENLGYSTVWLGTWYTRPDASTNTDIVDTLVRSVKLSVELGDLVLNASIAGLSRDFVRYKMSIISKEAIPWQMDSLKKIARYPGSTFTFAHFLLPHHPYIYLADGSEVPPDWNTLAWTSKDLFQKAYIEQLKYANLLLKETISSILENSELTPIIILQSDEGPVILEEKAYGKANGTFLGFETSNPILLRYRFSAFSALLLPGLGDNQKLAYGSEVNTFRLILRDYFDLEYELLPERCYLVSSYFLPKELRDVTEVIKGSYSSEQ